ncbi:MAG: hypothetical protein ACK559_16955, partial [bacterium]
GEAEPWSLRERSIQRTRRFASRYVLPLPAFATTTERSVMAAPPRAGRACRRPRSARTHGAPDPAATTRRRRTARPR